MDFHPHTRTDRTRPYTRTWGITAVTAGGHPTINVGYWRHPRQAFRFALDWWHDDPGLVALTVTDETGTYDTIELTRGQH